MQLIQEAKDHRRFLKQTVEHYKVGAYFPEQLILFPKTDPVSFEWMQHTNHGTIIFIMSEACSACNIEPAISFMKAHPAFDYCLLYEGTPQSVDEQQAGLPVEIRIHRCDTMKLHNQIKVNVVPYVLVFNKIGQAVGADTFHDLTGLERTASPLIRVYRNGQTQT
ncbi:MULTISPECIES: hypothetical protein [Paenibacillus]|uniref:Thioredoxin domain-containing protein n=2 Tax=Paenibacillus TaxID=44249 RepID=A0A1V4HL23_9BACL|nr:MULTISPECIES: hypothetical protein [Paenibacillus]MEC0231971.1 hypothetical protein [Paenibacillus alba]OPH57838.1 hypothetical protein BC351_04910 [Paenibacillus ferrarius]